LLDLTSPAQAGEVRAILRVLKESETLVLEEALPGPEQARLPGFGGHYLAEFVASLLWHESAGGAVGECAGHQAPERANDTTLSPGCVCTLIGRREQQGPGGEVARTSVSTWQ